MAEYADGGGGSATEFEVLSYLVHADRPEHIRASGSPWPGVARVVEQAAAVLEDGQVRLAEVWRSPAGQLYLSKMDEVTQAMREISVVARHNGQVMDAAADTLDAKQKDFAVLSTAPLPSDARESYARAIVASLDESYQQSAANFRPVPPAPNPDIGWDSSGSSYWASRRNSASGGESAAGNGSSADTSTAGGSASTTPRWPPSWVPTQPDAAGPGNISRSALAPAGGPHLQGMPAGPTHSGGGSAGTPDSPGGMPGTTPHGGPPFPPGAPAPAEPPFSLSPGRAGARSGGVPSRPAGSRSPAGQQPWLPGRPGTPGAPYAVEAATVRPGAAGGRAGAGQSGALVGGMPAGAASGAGRSGWHGYRRPPERFPTSEQTAVTPLIGAMPADEPELVSTDYADEYGNQITIRRPA
jgi:hypothetical protein